MAIHYITDLDACKIFEEPRPAEDFSFPHHQHAKHCYAKQQNDLATSRSMASAPQDFPVSVQAMISLSKRIPLPLAPIVEVDAWIGNWYLIHNPPLVKRADIPATFHLTGKQLRESSAEELAVHFEDFVPTMTKDMAIKLANDISDLKEENFNGIRKREMVRLQPMLVVRLLLLWPWTILNQFIY